MTNKERIIAAKLHRDTLLQDAFRPRFHFALLEDFGLPGDPNGAFYANGRCHLMYLYKSQQDGFRWGHVSSIDLLHWRHHLDALIPDEIESGAFSGGAFVDDDLTAYISYTQLSQEFATCRDHSHGLGIGLLKSNDFHYEKWEKLGTIIPSTSFGILETEDSTGKKLILGCADPSNIWKQDGIYYLQTGNLLVIDKFGRSTINEYSGDSVDLFRSVDLKTWTYAGKFYERRADNTWTQLGEDDMCPSFLPLPTTREGGLLSTQYLQLFISHNKGCQYYVGSYANERFIPQHHGRMTFADDAYFAPEALMDAKNRQIMWVWFRDNLPKETETKEWSGVFSLPRTLWWENDQLHLAPVPELKTLRHNEHHQFDYLLSNQSEPYEHINPRGCEFVLDVDPVDAEEVGIIIANAQDASQFTRVYVSQKKGELIVDSLASNGIGRLVKDTAPLVTTKNHLRLNIFIDQSVIEVFANDTQAIGRRVYTDYPATTISLFVKGRATIRENSVYEMMPTNPY